MVPNSEDREAPHIRVADQSHQENPTPERRSISSVSTSTDPVAAATHLRLGVDHPLDPDAEEVVVQAGRIKRIENLEALRNLKALRLIANVISEIGGLERNENLEHLELYQNSVTKISNIHHLRKLKILDLSFNEIRKIEGIEELRDLRNIYLSSNKISKIENLNNLKELRLLELGSNRIRTIEGLESLVHLEELWLGRNKITSMALPFLPRLRLLSLQSTRLTDWDSSISRISSLEELYLSHNRLPSPPPEFFVNLVNLTTIDIGSNRITSLLPFGVVTSLEELWVNDNLISDENELANLCSLGKLQTIYLERNPLQESLGPAYRTVLRERVPGIRQIDAILVDAGVKVRMGQESAPKPIMKGK